MRIRRLTALLTICGAVLAAGGCGNTAAAVDTGSAPLSLTIWVDEKRAPAVKEAADRFAAESGITVATEVVAKDLQTTFVTAAQAGKGPDLVLGALEGNYNPKDFGLAKPEARTAFEKIAKLGEKGEGALKRSISNENAVTLFTGKKTAFLLSGPWQFAEINKSGVKYDITPIPPFAGGKPTRPFVTVDALYVASKAKNKLLTQEFATNYFTHTDTAVALYKTDPRPPALIDALNQVKGSDTTLEKVLAAGQQGDIMPAIPAMATVWDPLGKAGAAVIGGANPGSTVDAAAKAIAAQIK